MPRVFGLELKPWMLWVAGGAAILVLVMYTRRGGQSVPIPSPQPDFGGIGGGGGGSQGPAPYTPPPSASEEVDEFTRQLQELQLEERRTELTQRKAMFELEREQQGILANLFTRTATARAELEEEVYQGQQRAAEAVFKDVGKYPVKCPPGMHPANVPGVGITCRQLGDPDGGRGFRPFKQIGEVFSGFLTGVGMAAPSIGYGATQAWAGRQGVIPTPQAPKQRKQPGQWERLGTRSGSWGTPGINPYGSGLQVYRGEE